MNWYKRSAEHTETITNPTSPIPGLGIDLLLNPDKADLKMLAQKTGEIRGLIIGTDRFWAWNVFDAIHAVVSDQLSKIVPVGGGIPVVAGVHGGQIYYITITDFSSRGKWFENPEVKEAVLANEPFMSLTAAEFMDNNEEGYGVRYFNQDIVGKWDDQQAQAQRAAFEEQDKPTDSYYTRWGD